MQSSNSQSLLSSLSNVSYRQPKKMYSGSEFFKESLPPGHDFKSPTHENLEQQIDIEALGNSSAFKCYQVPKQHYKIETLYWACDHNIEGTSDNEEQLPKIEHNSQLCEVKEENNSEMMQSSFNNVGQDQIKEQSDGSIVMKMQEGNASESLSEKGEPKIKNETKNIPKNFGKAIIIFIEKNPKLLAPILQQYGASHSGLMNRLRSLKKKINTIADLRNLWSSEPESRCLRVVSNLFLRRYSLHYIYNSRIKTRLCHSKYKKRLQQAIVDPFEFNHIKEY